MNHPCLVMVKWELRLHLRADHHFLLFWSTTMHLAQYLEVFLLAAAVNQLHQDSHLQFPHCQALTSSVRVLKLIGEITCQPIRPTCQSWMTQVEVRVLLVLSSFVLINDTWALQLACHTVSNITLYECGCRILICFSLGLIDCFFPLNFLCK